MIQNLKLPLLGLFIIGTVILSSCKELVPDFSADFNGAEVTVNVPPTSTIGQIDLSTPQNLNLAIDSVIKANKLEDVKLKKLIIKSSMVDLTNWETDSINFSPVDCLYGYFVNSGTPTKVIYKDSIDNSAVFVDLEHTENNLSALATSDLQLQFKGITSAPIKKTMKLKLRMRYSVTFGKK